jgi:hypothetical protein
MPKLRWAASCFGRQSNASRKYGKIISIYPHVPSEICLHEDITSRAQPDLSGTPFSLTQPNWASQWSCHSCLQLSSGKVSREDYGEPQRCETPLLVAVLDVFGRSSVNTREQHLVFTGFTEIRKFPWKSWNSHFFIFLFLCILFVVLVSKSPRRTIYVRTLTRDVPHAGSMGPIEVPCAVCHSVPCSVLHLFQLRKIKMFNHCLICLNLEEKFS